MAFTPFRHIVQNQLIVNVDKVPLDYNTNIYKITAFIKILLKLYKIVSLIFLGFPL